MQARPEIDAEISECFSNVERKVAADGGATEYGWVLVEGMPSVLLEAEFHAVWLKDGERLDVTPRSAEFPQDRILFLPDPNRTFEGVQIDNVRVALKHDRLIGQFIEVSEQYFDHINAGLLEGTFGEINLDAEASNMGLKRDRLGQALFEKYYEGV